MKKEIWVLSENYPPPLESPGPGGGIRWRKRCHVLNEIYSRLPLFKHIRWLDPDQPEPGVNTTEPETYIGPLISSTPPAEARVGEELVYQARAHDSATNGFTWYFEKPVPEGLSVDRYTGEVRWTPTEGGYYDLVLCIRSYYGHTAKQSWRLCVRKPQHKHPPVINQRFTEALRRKAERRNRPIPVWRERRVVPRRATAMATAPPTWRVRTETPLRM